MNKAILIGRLTRDTDVRYTKSGTMVVSFTVAVDRQFKNQAGERETDFIPIVAWGRLAEHCSKYIGKGSLVCVTGRIQVRSYEDKNGQRRYVTEIIAEEIQFLDRRRSGDAETDTASPFDDMDFMNDFPSEDDVPF